MAEPRCEPPVPSAFAMLQLREAEGDVAISKGSPRGRAQRLARARNALPFFLALHGRGSG